MQPDDEAPLTLSKWPFYVGDGLLVGIALAIAILSGWQLSNWQVASCVMSVALGAALFVLPYVVEYNMRRGEAVDDRSAEMRLLQAQLKRFEAALIACNERLEGLESAAGSARQYQLLAAAVDQKFADTAQVVDRLSAEITAMEGGQSEQLTVLTALQAQVAQLSADAGGAAATSADWDGVRARIEDLDTRLIQAVEPIESYDARLQALEGAAKESPEKRAPRAGRQRRTADSGLLHRAMQEKQDSSSTAVSRIIDAKQKLTQPLESSEAESSVAATAEPSEPIESPVLADASESAEVGTGADQPTDPDVLPAAKSASQGAELSAAASLLEPDDQGSTLEPQPEVAAGQGREVPDVAAVEEPAEAQSGDVVAIAEAPEEDLFGEVVQLLPSRASVKKNDTVLTVSILIGIGNKPYLRGSGAGLNWDSGVPMEFEEIGKWSWVAPADFDGSVELQLFRNDEDADRKGTHVLQAGQKLEVTPVF
jgi:hypothetical protein